MFFKFSRLILKTLFTKPVTVKYPFGPRIIRKGSRGSVQINIEQCIFCGICQKKCPAAAIEVIKTDKKWLINLMRCITCNACVEACPKKCLRMDEQYSASVTEHKEDTFQQDAPK